MIDVPTSLWYYDTTPSHFWWTRTFSVSISCEMKFKMFPFDKHNCTLELISGSNDNFTTIESTKVFVREKDINYRNLAFHFKIQAKEPSKKYLNPEFHVNKCPTASLEILLERKQSQFWRLFSEFYFPTFAFSITSLFAFSIPIDSVSLSFQHKCSI